MHTEAFTCKKSAAQNEHGGVDREAADHSAAKHDETGHHRQTPAPDPHEEIPKDKPLKRSRTLKCYVKIYKMTS